MKTSFHLQLIDLASMTKQVSIQANKVKDKKVSIDWFSFHDKPLILFPHFQMCSAIILQTEEIGTR